MKANTLPIFAWIGCVVLLIAPALSAQTNSENVSKAPTGQNVTAAQKKDSQDGAGSKDSSPKASEKTEASINDKDPVTTPSKETSQSGGSAGSIGNTVEAEGVDEASNKGTANPAGVNPNVTAEAADAETGVTPESNQTETGPTQVDSKETDAAEVNSKEGKPLFIQDVDPSDSETEDATAPTFSEEAPVVSDTTEQTEPDSDGLYSKGSMEFGFGLGFYGSGDDFATEISALYDYYFVNRLAAGLKLEYGTVVSDSYDYPQSLSVFPFLKFILLKGKKFMPYVIAGPGREFQFAGAKDDVSGQIATSAWFVDVGLGANIKISRRFFVQLQLDLQYKWWDETRIYGYDDHRFKDVPTDDEQGFFPNRPESCYDPLLYDETCGYPILDSDDADDKDGELFFPLIQIGFIVLF